MCRASRSACGKACVEGDPVTFARGGRRPPRMGSNSPKALFCKAFGERSEDFPAPQGRKSNGIFGLPQKSSGPLRQPGREARHVPGLPLFHCSGGAAVEKGSVRRRMRERRKSPLWKTMKFTGTDCGKYRHFFDGFPPAPGTI